MYKYLQVSPEPWKEFLVLSFELFSAIYWF